MINSQSILRSLYSLAFVGYKELDYSESELRSPFQESVSLPPIIHNSVIRNEKIVFVYRKFFHLDLLDENLNFSLDFLKISSNEVAKYTNRGQVEINLIETLLDILKSEHINYFILRKYQILSSLAAIFDSRSESVQVYMFYLHQGLNFEYI
jgi:hypothetical protein